MIAVLGRGKSLKHYKKCSHLFDKIYIIGRFNKEIKKMGIKHLVNKKVIHVAARTSHPLISEYYRSLNIPYVQTFCYSIEKEFRTSYGKDHRKKYPAGTIFKTVPDSMKNRGLSPIIAELIAKHIGEFDNYKDLCSFLEKKYAKEVKETQRRTRYWPTTGIFAVDLALNENDLKELYLFGMDLYTGLTYVMHKNEEFKKPVYDATTNVAKYFLKQLVKEFPNVNFYSSSKSDEFKFNLLNWNLI